MITKYFVLLTFLIAFAGFGQLSPLNPVRLAQSKFSKSKWHDGRALLDKAIRKDSLQVQAHFVYSKLFLNKRFENYNIDSAYLFAQQAASLWINLTSREQERLRKFPIDSTLLYKLNRTIDSLAFALAKERSTETAYLHFLEVYSKSPERALAVELRDETAFVDALKQNTHTAFQTFLNKYPTGHRSVEAKQRYEKLLFEFATRGKALIEFKQFVAENPTSPHLHEAIAHIFETETLNGEQETFERFIRQYPNTPSAKRAATLLIHLLPEAERSSINDSLARIYPLNDWLPIHQENGWGFINDQGTIMLTGLPELQEEHFCEPLSKDFIVTTESIVGRNGEVIRSGKFESVIDIGAGYLVINQSDHTELLHKSGWSSNITDIQSARVIENRFLGIQRNESWALFSLIGMPLTEFVFQSIEPAGEFILFKRAGKTLLVPTNQILDFAQNQYKPIVADEIKPMGTRFWLRNGALEQVIDKQLNVIIPSARQQISFSSLGLMTKQNNKITLPEWPPIQSTLLESVTIAEPWAIMRGIGEKASLHHIPTKTIAEVQADSIWFDRSLVLSKHGDSTRLRLPNQHTISLPIGENIAIKQSKDSVLFILARNKTKTRIIDAQSLKELFRTEFNVEPVLRNVFIFENKGLKGLLDSKGKVILPAVYDAILYNRGAFSLLKNNLFGAFHPDTKKIIKPTYESNLRPIGSNAFIALKKSKWVFISSEGKPMSTFEYDDVQPWSDSMALVKKADRQFLIKMATQKIVIDSLESVYTTLLNDEPPVSIIERRGYYGLINHTGKIILKPTFEELVRRDANKKIFFLGLTKLNPENRQVTYYSCSGKLLYTFKASEELAYRLLCD